VTRSLLLPPGYELDQILAKRSDVVVLRARHGEETVVLRLDRGSEAREGRAELAVLARVDHPGVAPLLDHGPLPGGGQFVSRRWIEGEDLLVWSRDRSAEEIGRVVGRLCAALDHLHGHAFVHGDLKPENVLVSADARPVLSDFGLAHGSGLKRTEDGVDGTPFHISPEELLGLEVTWRADLFALGALLYRLLSPSTTRASDFYAHFPKKSFLDAAGTDLETLPSWSRDLVASLTARDPLRRPASAGVVGRLLADRLGGIETQESTPALRWPVGEGRFGWVDRWLQEEEPDDRLGRWIRVPEHEDPRGFWEHLRLRSSLVGRPSTGVDLLAELATIETGGAVDAWAARLTTNADAWLLVLLNQPDARAVRALHVLAVSCEQARRRTGANTPKISVISGGAPEVEGWEQCDVPLVDEGTITRFLTANFAEEDPERRQALGTRMDRAARGSATALDRILEQAQRQGSFLPTDRGFRLRPGALPEMATAEEAPLEGAADELTEEQRDFLTALQIAGRRAEADHLLELLDDDIGAFGRLVVQLQEGGWIELVRGAGGSGSTVVFLKRPGWSSERASALHARRADMGFLPEAVRMTHAFCARPDQNTGTALASTLAEMRGAGKPEAVLAACSELRGHAEAMDLNLPGTASEVLAEEAHAWCEIGQTEHALRVARQIAAEGDDRMSALAELVFAQVASLRNETKKALGHLDQVERLHPESRLKATVERIRVLHEMGQDEEVRLAVSELDPRALEAEGRLPSRRRAHLEYLSAMSAFRLGEVQAARKTMLALREEARERGDIGLEAPLCINLAIIDRRTGDLERAREELEACIELYERSGQISGLAHARATMGGLLRDMGELAQAEPPLISAMEIRERLGDPNGARVARGMLGLLHFERGHARAAIEVLESTASSFQGAQRRRHTPFLFAKAAEMRNRIGDTAGEVPEPGEEADPRILLARARISWMNGALDEAREFADRAAGLAASLNLSRLQEEARWVEQRIAGTAPAYEEAGKHDIFAVDRRIHELLSKTGDDFDQRGVQSLASEQEALGRDDRSARLWFALAARTDDPELSARAAERAREVLERCTRGLTQTETDTYRSRLLGEPDAWLGDLTDRIVPATNEEELEMEIVSLLDINRRLAQQKNLDTLLGVIVEHALEVTGGERGFLVLEEYGDLRFDTALDSCRGDIAQPEFEVSRSVVRRALDDGKPLLISNAVDDPSLAHQSSVVSLELRSILCVPFDITESLRGAIYVDHRLRTGAFDSRAEKLCCLLADQAALAIQQIRRLDEIRTLNRELERRVVRREADLRTARRALQAAPSHATAELVGNSTVMLQVKDLIGKAAPSSLAILIVGESGTGKEIAATGIHEQSGQSSGPFVSESCAAIPSSLIESELFGFRKGAFTGADRDRTGLIEQAHEGTLFLDEIGEMPQDLQAKLLRVLETGEIRRLGDDTPRKVDFRLVVATNRNLEEEMGQGRFREDLYYRLNGIRIEMPPLSSRTEDIPLLVEHFLEQEAHPGEPRRSISRAVLSALARRPWPGNVRELRNEIARMCVLSEGALDDPALVSKPARIPAEDAAEEILPLAEVERQAIVRAIEHAGGDKRRAAELLGISRAKVYQRLKDWKGDTSPTQ